MVGKLAALYQGSIPQNMSHFSTPCLGRAKLDFDQYKVAQEPESPVHLHLADVFV